jgi:hypothetical protein
MPELKFIVAQDRYEDFKEKFLKVYPNNRTIPDPEWVDPEDGSEAPQIPAYTDAEWIWQHYKEMLVMDYKRGRRMIYQEAHEQIDISDDIT